MISNIDTASAAESFIMLKPKDKNFPLKSKFKHQIWNSKLRKCNNSQNRNLKHLDLFNVHLSLNINEPNCSSNSFLKEHHNKLSAEYKATNTKIDLRNIYDNLWKAIDKYFMNIKIRTFCLLPVLISPQFLFLSQGRSNAEIERA